MFVLQITTMPVQVAPIINPTNILTHPEVLSHLRGQYVYLEPAREQDRASMRTLARDERIWEFTKTLMIDDGYDEQFDGYFDEALGLETSASGQAFVIRAHGPGLPADEREDHHGMVGMGTGAIIGMTRLYAIDWKDRRLEIGHTWYIPGVWGKVHNKECKLLLLQYIFEHLVFHRVEFRVAHQNLRSQKAVAKIGGVREGELRKFTKRNDGSWRNTVIFSILDDEWPAKKEVLARWVSQLRS